MAGKTYGPFHIDLGFGNDAGDEPETLTGDDLLAFANILPAKVLALPTPQQVAEKIHAYTKPWSDRENMRTKDLVDLVLMIETSAVAPHEIATAVARTFARRAPHPCRETFQCRPRVGKTNSDHFRPKQKSPPTTSKVHSKFSRLAGRNARIADVLIITLSMKKMLNFEIRLSDIGSGNAFHC